MEEQFPYTMIQSLKLAAADFNSQINILPSFVDIPYEVVSTFDDVFAVFDQVIAANLVNKQQIEAILMVDNQCNKISSNRNVDLWTIQAMKEEKEWSNLREAAKMALSTFGETSNLPDLQWITYIPGNDNQYNNHTPPEE
jgi:hypothetical protein